MVARLCVLAYSLAAPQPSAGAQGACACACKCAMTTWALRVSKQVLCSSYCVLIDLDLVLVPPQVRGLLGKG